MRGPLALVGILVVLAGLHLLWQSRRDIYYWTEAGLKIVRAALRKAERPSLPRLPIGIEQILRLSLGLSLVLIVGPVLILLGLLP